MNIRLLPRLRHCTMTASLLLATFMASHAQPNVNDPGFNAGTGFSSGFATGIPCEVTKIVMQPDGKILCGGIFTSFNGTDKRAFVRLNNDGSLDGSFNNGPSFGLTTPGYISADDIIVMPDGKIMVNGNFNSYDATPCNRVVRINSDGTLDQTFVFDPRMGGDFILQPDGKLIIGNARVNTDGTVDNNFSFAQQGNIALLPNGKFIGVGVTSKNIFRLNSDGSTDNSFSVPGSGFNGNVRHVVVQPDGKFIVSGQFSEFNGVTRHKFARLNSDGSLDPTFTPNTSSLTNTPECITLQPDGMLLVGSKLALYRLKADGTIDQSFQPPVIMGNDGLVSEVCIQGDGKILIGGDFAQAGTSTATGIARFMGAATGIKDNAVDNSLFSLFPNPTTNQLTIQCKGHSFPSASFTIYDATGKAVKQWADAVTGNYSKTVDIADLPQGQYILRTSVDKLAYQRFTVLHSK